MILIGLILGFVPGTIVRNQEVVRLYQLKERKILGFVPLFFPVALQKAWARSHPEPTFYDESGMVIPLCSTMDTHGWFYTVADKRPRCFYCRKYLDEIEAVIKADLVDEGLSLVLPDLPGVPLPVPQRPDFDFNSPVSATVNVLRMSDSDVDHAPLVRESKPAVMSLNSVQSYCLRCKGKTLILDPEYYDQESRRGIRRYLKGKCSVCGSKINAIVKSGAK